MVRFFFRWVPKWGAVGGGRGGAGPLSTLPTRRKFVRINPTPSFVNGDRWQQRPQQQRPFLQSGQSWSLLNLQRGRLRETARFHETKSINTSYARNPRKIRGGPRVHLNCPYPQCRSHTGKGFSRQGTLDKHLEYVHRVPIEPQLRDDKEGAVMTIGIKRERDSSSDEADLWRELKNVEKRLKIMEKRWISESMRVQLQRMGDVPRRPQICDDCRPGIDDICEGSQVVENSGVLIILTWNWALLDRNATSFKAFNCLNES